MNDNPFVSIIIPVYNREHLINNMLNSLIEQSYDNWECIIVDDGSIDNTKDVACRYVEKDSRFQFHNRPTNRKAGGNAARNYGFELSKGELVNWVDSDDKLHQNFISEKVKAFIENPKADAVLSKTVIINDSKGIKKHEERTRLTENLLEDFITLKVSWYIPDLIWKRSFLERQEELFNEQLLKGQDRDFHIRMLLHNPKIQIVDKYLYYYVVTSQDSISLKNSEKVAWSMFLGNTKRNQLLINKRKISESTKLMLLKQQMKLYPSLYKKKGILKQYIQEFKLLFVLNLQDIKWIIKFGLAILSFRIIGKGEKFLK